MHLLYVHIPTTNLRRLMMIFIYILCWDQIRVYKYSWIPKGPLHLWAIVQNKRGHRRSCLYDQSSWRRCIHYVQYATLIGYCMMYFLCIYSLIFIAYQQYVVLVLISISFMGCSVGISYDCCLLFAVCWLLIELSSFMRPQFGITLLMLLWLIRGRQIMSWC